MYLVVVGVVMTDKKIIDLETMVDIVGGKLSLTELTRELTGLYYHRSPPLTVVTIERDEKVKGYVSTIYIDGKSFEEYKIR